MNESEKHIQAEAIKIAATRLGSGIAIAGFWVGLGIFLGMLVIKAGMLG